MEYVVISGVSSGIGKASAQYLIQQGYGVMGSLRSAEDASRLKAELGTAFTPLLMDLTRDWEIAEAAETARQVLGPGDRIRALVNNAGIAVSGPLEDLPLDKIRHQFEVNVFGALALSQAFLPLLKPAHPGEKGGTIINISSISGRVSTPFLGPYSASKFALEAFSDALRRELSIYQIDVVIIEPGPVKTPIWEKASAEFHAREQSPYRVYFKGFQETIRKSELGGIEPSQVSHCIYNILRARKPRTRYLLTKQAAQIRLATILPDRTLDRILTKPFRKRKPEF